MLYSDAPELVMNFLSYKGTIQGRSPNTVFQYYHDLRHFFRYYLYNKYSERYKELSLDELSKISFSDCTDEDVKAVTNKDVYSFLLYCGTQRNNKADARARKLSTIKSLYKFLKNSFEIEINPTERLEAPKRVKKLPKYLTLEESVQLLESITPPNYERDYAIITIFLNCGLRVSELEGIDMGDFQGNFEALKIRGKGSKERIVYLNDACKTAIAKYLEVRPTDIKYCDKKALFVSRNRNRLNVKTIQHIVYKRLKEAGLGDKKMSVHKLRHTAATLMYQHGHTDVRVLKDILGHEEMSTTQIYTHLSNDQMLKAAQSNPLSAQKPKKPVKETEPNEE